MGLGAPMEGHRLLGSHGRTDWFEQGEVTIDLLTAEQIRARMRMGSEVEGGVSVLGGEATGFGGRLRLATEAMATGGMDVKSATTHLLAEQMRASFDSGKASVSEVAALIAAIESKSGRRPNTSELDAAAPLNAEAVALRYAEAVMRMMEDPAGSEVAVVGMPDGVRGLLAEGQQLAQGFINNALVIHFERNGKVKAQDVEGILGNLYRSQGASDLIENSIEIDIETHVFPEDPLSETGVDSQVADYKLRRKAGFSRHSSKLVGPTIVDALTGGPAKGQTVIGQAEILRFEVALRMPSPVGMSRPPQGPVLSGVLDTITGNIFFASNNLEGGIPKQLHPILKKRLAAWHPVRPPSRAGIAGSHSEVYALNAALWERELAMGHPIDESELSQFMLHNRGLRKKYMVDGRPPRCFHCQFLTNGVKLVDVKERRNP